MMLNFPKNCAMCGGKWFINHECPPSQNAVMAQTSKEKQESFRARQAMLGLKEVRGIYAPDYLQDAIKDFVRKWVDERLREDAANMRKDEK